MALAVVLRVQGLLAPPLLLLGVLPRDFFHGSSGRNPLLLTRENRLGRQPEFVSTNQWVTLGSRWGEWPFCTALKSTITSPLRELLRTEPTYLESCAFQVEIESGPERGRQNKSRTHLQASWTDWIAAFYKAVCAPRVDGPHVSFSWKVRKTARSELTHIMKQEERTLISSVKSIVGFHSTYASEKKSFLFPFPSGLSSAPLQVSLVDNWGRASQRKSLEIKSCLPLLPLASKLLSSAFL